MFYIDLTSGETVDSTGKISAQVPHLTAAEIQTLELTFFQDGEVFTFPEGAVVTAAGDVDEKLNAPIFIASGTISADRQSVSLPIDTNTKEFYERIKASGTICFIDLYIRCTGDEYDRRLTRFHAIADRRILLDHVPPEPLTRYYTKTEIDALLENHTGNSTESNASSNIILEHIFYHDYYGIVSYLDADNSIKPVGFFAEPWQKITLYTISAEPEKSGNIVLVCGENRVVVPVGSELQKAEWIFSIPVSGQIEITRDTTDPADTLKTTSGDIITAVVADWKVY